MSFFYTRIIRSVFALSLLFASGSDAAERIGAAFGFDHSSVSAMVRDQNGYVWLGGDNGLFRFDGRQMRAMDKSVAGLEKMPGAQISALRIDGKHLWLASLRSGLWWLDVQRNHLVEIKIPGLRKDANALAIRSIVIQNMGHLWLGTDGDGLIQVKLKWVGGVPIATASHSIKKIASQLDGLPADRIWTADLFQNNLLVGTAFGITQIDTETFATTTLSLPAPMPEDGKVNVEEIMAWHDGSIFIGTWDYGLFRWFPKQKKMQHYPVPSLENQSEQLRIMAFTKDANSAIWIGTESGVRVWQAQCDCIQTVHIRDQFRGGNDGLAIRNIVIDGQGGGLVGTWGNGLWRLHESDLAIRRVRYAGSAFNSFPSGRVRAMVQDHAGELWLGTLGKGLYRSRTGPDADAETAQFELVMDSTSKQKMRQRLVWSLFEDSDRQLWVGTDAGVAILSPDRRQWFYPDNSRLPGPGVRAIAPHPMHGNLIATTGGLGLVNPRRDTSTVDLGFVADQEGLDLTLTAVLVLPDRRVLLGSQNGLHVLDQNLRRVHSFRDGEKGFEGRMIWSVQSNSGGEVYAATNLGICKLISNEQVSLWQWKCDALGSLINKAQILNVVFDRGDDAWITTNRSLIRWRNPNDLLRIEPFEVFDEDGFESQSAARTADGRLMFGVSDGWLLIDPVRMSAFKPSLVPSPSLTAVEYSDGRAARATDGSVAPFISSLNRAFNDPGVELQLGAPLLSNQDNLSWQYRVTPSENDHWEDSKLGRIDLRHLGPGHYQILARAKDRHGQIGDAKTVLQLNITPPFWQTWIFRGLVLIAALLTVVGFYFWRTRELRAHRAALAFEVAARTSELERNANALQLMNTKLFNASIRDPLTELFNRRHMFAAAFDLMREANNKSEVLALAIIDVDHFKSINDQYGHQAGDSALRELARVLESGLQGGEFVGRFGGEEFAIFLRGRDSAALRVWAELLLTRIRELTIEHAAHKIKLTISLGIAIHLPYDGLDLDQWIEQADTALYQAKFNGRDRATFAKLMAR